VADLVVASVPGVLAELGLPDAIPGREQWPVFQQVGERLHAEGFDGVMYRSAARPQGVCLCVFRAVATDILTRLEPLAPPRRVEQPPAPPPRQQCPRSANDADIVGMALLEPCRADDGAGAVILDALHISMVFIDPASQRQGVGGRLMRYALDSARASGVSSVSLWTACENTGARKLYEALGMKPTRTRRVNETVEWVRYELDLESASI
jgi:ribosomal protein S18 acetylase RimI-like enzyme